MKVFFDTNILLDAFLGRAGAMDCARVMEACVQPWNQGFVAPHTLSNAFYLIARHRGQSAAWKFINEILEWATVYAADTEAVKRTRQLGMEDFEDALQIVSAEACGADLIITRNTKDFVNKTHVRIMLPENFVDEPVA